MTLRNLQLGISAVLLSAACNLGCDAEENSVSGTATIGGTSTGGSSGLAPTAGSGTSGTGGDPAPGECAEVETIVGLDDPTAVGLTAREFADGVVGLYAGSLAWHPDSDARYTGDPAPIDLTIEVIRNVEEAKSIDGQLLRECDHDGACFCRDALELDVLVRVQAGDGLFAEEFEGIARYESDGGTWGVQRVEVTFDPDDTAGTFSSQSLMFDASYGFEHLELSLAPNDGSVEGYLRASFSDAPALVHVTVGELGAVFDADACSSFRDVGPSCELAGCGVAQGSPVQPGSPPDACPCSTPRAYCLRGDAEGLEVETLYTREWDNGDEVYDEVVMFGFDADLSNAWRRCEDAPDVELCGCAGCQ